MISSKKICLSKTINSLIFTRKTQNSLQVQMRMVMVPKTTMVEAQSTTSKTLMMLCLIWQHQTMLVVVVLVIARSIRTPVILRLHSISQILWVSTLMNKARQKMHGSERKIKCERSLRNRLSISWRIELLNQIDRQETRIHRLKLSPMTITTVTLILQRNLKTKIMAEGQVPWMLPKFSWILSKSKRQSRWHMVNWSNSKEIDYTRVTETVWTL